MENTHEKKNITISSTIMYKNELKLSYKYMKLNIPILTSSLVMCNILTGFDKTLQAGPHLGKT